MITASTEAHATLRTVVRPREYFDSVFLMRISERLGRLPGVTGAAAIMATDANKQRLAEARLAGPELAKAGADDLVIAIRAKDEEAAERALTVLATALTASSELVTPARNVEEALTRRPDANVAVISVPGQYAVAEVRRALEHGLHAFVFSGNVPLDEERTLKEDAHRRGLLVMGPDCGTAIVRGVGLGFANAVRRGAIGVVGASGTGMQEITSLVHQAGAGISHALGTGSHDPSDAVGAISTIDALDALAAEAGTTVIVLVSKTIGATTRSRIDDAIARAGKPVVTCIFGDSLPGHDRAVRTFEEAAATAVSLAGGGRVPIADISCMRERLALERSHLAPSQHRIAGLFAGGSFALQADAILAEMGVPSTDRGIVDLGAETLTEGRPHPMIDSRLRRERIAAAARDDTVAVVLFDIVLGYGAADDPAGDLLDAIERSRAEAAARGHSVSLVASLTGTEGDPQGLAKQRTTLEHAGVVVLPTTARAARAAGAIVGAAA